MERVLLAMIVLMFFVAGCTGPTGMVPGNPENTGGGASSGGALATGTYGVNIICETDSDIFNLPTGAFGTGDGVSVTNEGYPVLNFQFVLRMGQTVTSNSETGDITLSVTDYQPIPGGVRVTLQGEREFCDDSCWRQETGDGVCDERGAVSAPETLPCDVGTDCTDCGPVTVREFLIREYTSPAASEIVLHFETTVEATSPNSNVTLSSVCDGTGVLNLVLTE